MITLSKDALAFLRKATGVSFHTNPSIGQNHILATQRLRDGSEIELRIQLENTSSTVYKSSQRFHSGFCYICSAQYDLAFQTTLKMLRPGDGLTLHWVANNDTENMRDAGFVSDQLFLTVSRKSRTYTFHVDTVTGLDNTARMVKTKPKQLASVA